MCVYVHQKYLDIQAVLAWNFLTIGALYCVVIQMKF